MQTLLLQFPGRRYHATPWGHHVNEGLIEWPPSPWRLLRALISVGYTSGLWDGNGPDSIGRSLIEKLAGVLPRYRMPLAAGTHSRHYMPLAKFKKNREDTTLVFDTWAQVDDGVLAVTWELELSPEETELLAALAARLNYLGRSESWIAARLAEPYECLPNGFECYPSNDPPSPGWEQVSLMAVQDAANYIQWRGKALEQALAELPDMDRGKGKLTREEKKILAQRDKIDAQYPPDLIACLQVETSWLRKYGWNQPPGSRRVLYWRRIDALEAGAPRSRPTKVSARIVEAILLSISTASGNLHALPQITRTLPQAELLHAALVHHANNIGAGDCTLLIGRDDKRNPLAGPHDHAHILTLDLDGDGHLDHILIWCPAGLDGIAQAAVRAVRRTYTKGGIEPLRVAVAGFGDLSDFRRMPGLHGENLRAILGPVEGATKWVSITPFIAPRYLKKNGRNTLAGQVASELASRGFPAPAGTRILAPGEQPDLLRHRHFVRRRRRGPQPPIDFGYSLEICFDKPVSGPLCLGYGSHFGLGLFGFLG